MDSIDAAANSSGRWNAAILLLLVAVPIVFNAIMLLPEITTAMPSLNDDNLHYLLVRQASAALEHGANPFDFWVPQQELGFPQFFYYQHLPHLVVVLLHRLLFESVNLLTLFNLVRYLLMVLFPLTVWWSMRTMEFSATAAGIGAACASLFSGNFDYGFSYESYVWRGWGLYTQLWAMHLFLISTACLERLIYRGVGYRSSVVFCSMLVLSHLIYAYMLVVTAIVLVVLALWREPEPRFIAVSRWKRALPILGRVSVVGLFSGVITSYLWFPILREQQYLRGIKGSKGNPFGALEVTSRLLSGQMFDHNRLPVLTLLLGLGFAWSIGRHTRRQSRVALALLTVWLMLYSGRPLLGSLIDLLPMHGSLPMSRFSGGVDLAAILLIGVGGEWLWTQFSFLGERWRAIVPATIMLLVMTPALIERHAFYTNNATWMKETQTKLESDRDWQAILETLKRLPPGRIYAGQRDWWGRRYKFDSQGQLSVWGEGRSLKIGSIASLAGFDLLIFDDFDTLAPPYQGVSLNSDFVFYFDDANPAWYNLFNVRYVVAPAERRMELFLTPLKTTPKYTLYRADSSGGYGELVKSMNPGVAISQRDLHDRNLAWLMSDAPAQGSFIRWSYTPGRGAMNWKFDTGVPADGSVTDQEFGPGLIRLRVNSPAPSLLVIKTTYHPNWRVTVDGRAAETFMASPSFIGVQVAAGDHLLSAEYLSGGLKKILLMMGALALLAALALGGRFDRLDARWYPKLPPKGQSKRRQLRGHRR
jgi:hypothetical protein